jgi:hypothetical protein
MFLDSIDNRGQITSYADDNFSNHPGFIGKFGDWVSGVVNPSGAEADRVSNTENSLKSKCDLGDIPGKNCAELDDAYWCLDDEQQKWMAASTGSKGARRVRDRNLAAVSKFQGPVSNAQDSRDCDGSSSPIDDRNETIEKAQEQHKVLQAEIEQQKQQTQQLAQQSQSALELAKFEAEASQKKLLTIGGGVVVVLLMAVILK